MSIASDLCETCQNNNNFILAKEYRNYYHTECQLSKNYWENLSEDDKRQWYCGRSSSLLF